MVVAVARDDGRLLMIRRSAQVQLAPLTVCFPGGTVEAGESQAAAVVREMREELGLEVRPLRQVWRWDFPDKPLTLWGWLAEVIGPQQPRPDEREVAEMLWLSPEEGSNHPAGLGTNGPFIQCVVKAMEAPMRGR